MKTGNALIFLDAFAKAGDTNRIDRMIGIGRKAGPALTVRLVAIRKPPEAAAVSRDQARREAAQEKAAIAEGTLIAADWVLLVTTLPKDQFSADEIAELYRTRWRIEMAFKRLKSVIGPGGPPGQDPQVAKTWVLAHLLMILMLEPHISAPEVSPRRVPVRRGPVRPGRVTAPAAWRMTCLAAKVLLAAIRPAPTNLRHLREPPRKRLYQHLHRLC